MALTKSINFADTFKPEKHYISSVLSNADDIVGMNLDEVSARTGIPQGKKTGKVKPHIIYSEYMGLVKGELKTGRYTLSRTKLGQAIYTEDPALQEQLSVLLCHGMMLRENNGAPMWSTAFKRVLPMYREGISNEHLIMELNRYVDGRVTKKNFSPFVGSYINGIFHNLNVIKLENNIIQINSTQYDEELIYLYAYVLWKYWEEKFSNEEEITSDQLESLNFGKAFGWSLQKEYELLQHFVDEGLLYINRQLMPYAILKLVDEDLLIKKLYSKLL